MARTFSRKVPGTELVDEMERLLRPAILNQGGGSRDEDPRWIATGTKFIGEWAHYFRYLSKTVDKDLSKVQFDSENGGCFPRSWGPSRGDEKFLGVHTTKSGLTFVGAYNGGDWEVPVFFIIYHDGKKLRGYVPEAGNPWNTSTKMAYGNEGESEKETQETDEENCQRRFGCSVEDVDFDPSKILAEIEEHITFKEK